MSTPTKTPMTPGEFLHRVATALNVPINAVPGDLDALADLICPALSDYTRTRTTLAVDCAAYNVPTSDADGPRSLYQMTGDVVKCWRDAAPAVSELAEIDTVIAAAGYIAGLNETTSGMVARALKDTREANDAREMAEEEARGLLIQRDEARANAADLAETLNRSAQMILRMSATISRTTR